jgi:hypothetical protein
MKNLIRKILKEELNEFEWVNDILNNTQYKFDENDDSTDLTLGDTVVFIPNEMGYKYERCAGKITSETEVKSFDVHAMMDEIDSEITISNIKCNPESYKFPNNEYRTTLTSEWFFEHNWYIINK